MKNIFKLFFAISILSGFLYSCNEEVAFDALTKAPSTDAAYYVQFLNASKTMETGVTEAGGLVEAKSTIAVSLMGMPQGGDIKVDLAPDPANTLKPEMYTLSANSITIPAGKTSGSVQFSTVASKMPVGQTLTFVLNMNAGDLNSPNPVATKLIYKVKRIEFCPLENGLATLVGSWSGNDGTGVETYPSQITTAVDGSKLAVSGIAVGFMNNFWAEEIVSGGTFQMTVTGNGKVDIPRQYVFTTVYDGANYDYEIKGSGKWENCGSSPHMVITYDIYYPGDEKGLAASYPSYTGGPPYITADINLTGTKSAGIISQNVASHKKVK